MTVEERDVAGLQDLPLRDKRIAQMCSYWLSLRQDGHIPLYRDVDPVAIPKLLSHVWFWCYDEAEDCFRGRLAGESILDVFGVRDMRGLVLHEFASQPLADELHKRYRRVIGQPAIAHYDGKALLQNGISIDVERIVFPMHDRNEDTSLVMGLSIYSWPQGIRSAPGFASEAGTILWAPIP